MQYFHEFEKLCRDTGKVDFLIYEIVIQDVKTIAYRFINVGNEDGWLFIFDEQGRLLTAGSTRMEYIVWAEQDLLDRYTDPEDCLKRYWGLGGFPGFEDSYQQYINSRNQ